MKSKCNVIILLLGALIMNNALAEQKFGVIMPAIENVGIIARVDNASGSITLGKDRYELTSTTIIHYAPGQDAVGYGKFKLAKDMNIGFKKEQLGSGKETNRLTEVWVLPKN